MQNVQLKARPIPAAQGAPQKTPAKRSLAQPVLVSSVFFMVVTGLAYPLATTGAAQLLFPHQAAGSLILRDGRAVGSEVIGQNFTAPGYFHARPSATTGPDPKDATKTVDQPYNAASSGASNQGPISKKLIDQIAARTEAYRKENGLSPKAPVPVDAVTASASGLDPEISVANARLQAPRVARARGLAIEQVSSVLDQQTSPRQLGLLGDPRVNVLELNLALDKLAKAQPSAARPVR